MAPGCVWIQSFHYQLSTLRWATGSTNEDMSVTQIIEMTLILALRRLNGTTYIIDGLIILLLFSCYVLIFFADC